MASIADLLAEIQRLATLVHTQLEDGADEVTLRRELITALTQLKAPDEVLIPILAACIVELSAHQHEFHGGFTHERC